MYPKEVDEDNLDSSGTVDVHQEFLDYYFEKEQEESGLERGIDPTVLPDFENSSDSRSINMAFVEDVAGINEIMHPEHAAKDCYDLQGRKVAKLGRGIFVKNGKKVVVK